MEDQDMATLLRVPEDDQYLNYTCSRTRERYDPCKGIMIKRFSVFLN